MVIELDGYDALLQRHGLHVMQLIARKLTKMVTARIRTEDNIAQRSNSQFVLLSPGIDLVSSCAFALRLRSSFEKLVMAFREERIRVTVTIGVAEYDHDLRDVPPYLLDMLAEAGIC